MLGFFSLFSIYLTTLARIMKLVEHCMDVYSVIFISFVQVSGNRNLMTNHLVQSRDLYRLLKVFNCTHETKFSNSK